MKKYEKSIPFFELVDLIPKSNNWSIELMILQRIRLIQFSKLTEGEHYQ